VPLAFTASVPSGKLDELREETAPSSRKRAKEPRLPRIATPIHAGALTP
jgi:hypothetical protein